MNAIALVFFDQEGEVSLLRSWQAAGEREGPGSNEPTFALVQSKARFFGNVGLLGGVVEAPLDGWECTRLAVGQQSAEEIVHFEGRRTALHSLSHRSSVVALKKIAEAAGGWFCLRAALQHIATASFPHILAGGECS